MPRTFVITIARTYGSGGTAIAGKVAERLAIPCYEKEILEMASEQTGLDVRKFMAADERLRNATLLSHLKTVSTHAVLEPHEAGFESDDNLYNIQAQIIRTLANTTSCIVVGKCADFLLADWPMAASVFVTAPVEYCTERISERLGVGWEEAQRLIKATDAYRSNYYRYYTKGGKWEDPLNYDLTVNPALLGEDGAVSAIVRLAIEKLGALV